MTANPGPRPARTPPRDKRHHQTSLDDLGTPLAATTFVVVDLETTGGSATDDAITEIGAVKVRGGEVLGEFQTLVDPGRPVPPMISALTGLTDAALLHAPPITAALPAFLEFAQGAVLVAHNAGFDIGFLKAAAARQHRAWPSPAVVDTVRLARAVLGRGETRNVKLATLAAHFGSPVTPTHRALDDARATVHVLHALIARVGTLGVHDVNDLVGLSRKVPESVRRKASWADEIPDAPGVYVFRDDAGRVLYVGTSGSLRARVRSYFTAAEQRSRVRQMVRIAASVTPIVCPTAIEAHVRELRLIAQHRPPYNQRSRQPERTAWLRLTDEPYPRLSVVRAPRGDATAIGPFPGRAAAQMAAEALQDAFAVRTCTRRLSIRTPSPDCARAELGRCGAPCTHTQSHGDYAALVVQVRHAMLANADPVIAAAHQRLERLTAASRFEEAVIVRDRLTTFLQAAATASRLRALTSCPLITAAAPSKQQPRAWDLVVIKHGRLVASACVPHGPRLRPALEALVATAPTLDEEGNGVPLAHIDEALAVLAWLEAPGVRLAEVDGTWAMPIGSAAGRVGPYRRARVAAIQASRVAAAAPLSIASAARRRA
jgi:DNA polymerase-3 subunit epsilon